jgi:uncharacterized protein with HEPN domain
MKNQKIIEKIITCIDTILKYTDKVDYEEFRQNTMMVEACVFNLSQIGELVNRLDKDYLEKHQEIPWFKIRGLRNRIIHDYEGINLRLIWEIIDLDIHSLKKDLLKLNS